MDWNTERKLLLLRIQLLEDENTELRRQLEAYTALKESPAAEESAPSADIFQKSARFEVPIPPVPPESSSAPAEEGRIAQSPQSGSADVETNRQGSPAPELQEQVQAVPESQRPEQEQKKEQGQEQGQEQEQQSASPEAPEEAGGAVLSETDDGEFSLFSSQSDVGGAGAQQSQSSTQPGPSGGVAEMDPELRGVTEASGRRLKIRLFRELFCPRCDVFAKRFENTRGQGYSFQCSNWWDQELCWKRLRKENHLTPELAAALETGAAAGKKGGKGKRRGGDLCQRCPGRKYRPLTDEDIKIHLLRSGAVPGNVLGMYASLAGPPAAGSPATHVECLCRFLAIDFDKSSWKEDVLAVSQVCRDWNIPHGVERSRSGQGAHLWIFFSQLVPARSARKLGNLLLTEAMRRCKTLKLDAYDRMFPVQDNMPKDGLGNLIALPLQGYSMQGDDPEQYNSVFVDQEFHTIPDQWAFLAQLERLSLADLEGHLAVHGKSGEYGILADSDSSTDSAAGSADVASAAEYSPSAGCTKTALSDAPSGSGSSSSTGSVSASFSAPKPWAKKPVELLSSRDFTQPFVILSSGVLYLQLEAMSARARNRISRLAAFYNPDFFRRQNSGEKMWGVPRIFSYSGEENRCLTLPRGCLDSLIGLLKNAGVSWELQDQRFAGNPIAAEFRGCLKHNQVPAAEALLKQDNGILVAATGFGKTMLAAWLIAQRKVSTLVLVESTTLLKQWQERLEQSLQFAPVPAQEEAEAESVKEEGPGADAAEGAPVKPSGRAEGSPSSPVGVKGGGKDTLTGRVDVGVVDSFLNRKTNEADPVLQNYGMVIVDECHHAAAGTYVAVLKQFRGKYLYGLTATPKRTDGKTPVLHFLFGPTRYQWKASEQAETHTFEHVLVPRFTDFRQPLTLEEPWTHAEALSAMALDEPRNQRILQDIKAALRQKRSPLVLTERVEHAGRLAELLEPVMQECSGRVFLLTGSSGSSGSGSPPAQRDQQWKELQEYPTQQPLVLVATTSYVGEGFDCPRLDTLFLTMPVKAGNRVDQYVGRIQREYPGKEQVYVYDYVDRQIPMLQRMYPHRLKAYVNNGYSIQYRPASPSADGSRLFNGETYLLPFQNDLKRCLRRVVISGKLLSLDKLESLLKLLRTGVSLELVLPATENLSQLEERTLLAPLEFCREHDIPVCRSLSCNQEFAVLDGRILWYGGVGLLGTPDKDSGCMRLVSTELCAEFLQTADTWRTEAQDRQIRLPQAPGGSS